MCARSAGYDAVDGVVLDIGVSSMQFDEAERGFSFRFDAPLDMRMGQDGPSAADLVAAATERDLSFIISILGEERFARGIARAIVRARAEAPITHHERTGGDYRACGARQAGRDSSGDAHVPGAANLHQ